MQLRPDQLSGLGWMRERERHEQGGVGILAWDMGLGKSVMMIQHAATTPAASGNMGAACTLIIVPLAVLRQLAEEFDKWGHARPHIYHGTRRQLSLLPAEGGSTVLTTYDVVRSEHTIAGSPLFVREWTRIMLDEGHTIRNVSSQVTRAVCALRGKHRWCFTGTPYNNKVADLKSVAFFFRRAPYDSEAWWRRASRSPALIRAWRSDMVLIQQRHQVGVTLPPKRNVRVEMTLAARARIVYTKMESIATWQYHEMCGAAPERRATLLGGMGRWLYRLKMWCLHTDLVLFKNPPAVNVKAMERARNEILNASLSDEERAARMALIYRAITCGCPASVCWFCYAAKPPGGVAAVSDRTGVTCVFHHACALCVETHFGGRDKGGLWRSVAEAHAAGRCAVCALDPGEDNRAAKMDAVAAWILDSCRRKVVVFSDSVRSLLMLERVLAEEARRRAAPLALFHYNGRTADRDGSLVGHKNTRLRSVLLCNIQCAGVGLNLSFCDAVVMLNRQPNPSLEDQSVDRVHRMGLATSIDVVRFITTNTIEVDIARIHAAKRRECHKYLGIKGHADHIDDSDMCNQYDLKVLFAPKVEARRRAVIVVSGDLPLLPWEECPQMHTSTGDRDSPIVLS